jgi:hypothetical protein
MRFDTVLDQKQVILHFVDSHRQSAVGFFKLLDPRLELIQFFGRGDSLLLFALLVSTRWSDSHRQRSNCSAS